MPAYICRTCGVQYPPSAQPPAVCSICDDERQYIRDHGQVWTTLDEMGREGHRNEITEVERGLFSIRTGPRFGIGQRALLVQAPGGNVL